MSSLSIEDIMREMGKNIFVHPLSVENIKGNTLNLTASRFAWSIKTKRSIYNESENVIDIPPNDTALIYTNEAIYVTNKIGGTYHSKVTWVSKGLGHIATTLDPEYLGLSLIAVHNHSEEVCQIKVGKTFVSVMLHYLKTATFSTSHNNIPGQTSILQDYYDTESFQEWLESNDWANVLRRLKKEVKDSETFKDLKIYLKEEKKQKNAILWALLKNPFTKYMALVILDVGIYLAIDKISKVFSLNWDPKMIVVPIVSFTLAFVANDLKKLFE